VIEECLQLVEDTSNTTVGWPAHTHNTHRHTTHTHTTHTAQDQRWGRR
jgi:hypothetical protein